MDDKRLKCLVAKFQGGDVEAGKELLALLYPIIDNYSYRYFGKESESCYYYVEDMLENFYGLMEKYVSKDTLFLTWFNKVIFRSYFYCEKYHLHHELWDPAIIAREVIDERNEEDEIRVDYLFSCLEGDEAKVMALRYPDFVNQVKIEKVFKDEKPEVRTEIVIELEGKLQNDRVEANTIYDKIVSIYHKKERILKSGYENYSPGEMIMRSERIEGLKKQRDKLMTQYRERLSTMSYKRIAKYLNRSVGAVSSLIHRGKDRMWQRAISQRVVGE